MKRVISKIVVSSKAPSHNVLWFDTDNKELKIWYNDNWLKLS